jgi:5-methylcytosine-specific restriction endonuclease McrA
MAAAISIGGNMKFKHPEDESFFRALLCSGDERLDSYIALFDFGSPETKRREFNTKRDSLLRQLLALHGRICMLRVSPRCTGGAEPLTVDHVIPLSSNKLNKELRRTPALPGRKVVTQSLGSNQPANLILACGPCNGAKKHRLLSTEKIRQLLQVRRSVLEA